MGYLIDQPTQPLKPHVDLKPIMLARLIVVAPDDPIVSAQHAIG